MIVHVNDQGRNMDIQDDIACLCYCHRAELSMHFFGRIGWQKADGGSVSKGCSLTQLVYHQDLEYYIKNFKMDRQESAFDKEALCEGLRTQKLKVAKLEEQNLEIPEIRQELKDSWTMVHAKDIETQKCGTQLQNIKGRHEKLRVNRNDLVEELEKISKHDRKKPSET